MPTIHRIGRLKIQVFADDHAPPHFHAWHPEGEVLVVIATLEPLAGKLDARELRKAMEWASANRDALENAWRRLNEEIR
ncbi:MAG: DUF4160 domain-containing protein [Geminicoccaceae bacterium]|nr:DUF4160 domain-containing protein [Geminicoccaceae bacterium]